MENRTTPKEDKLARAGLYGFYSGVLLREFDLPTLQTLLTEKWRRLLATLEIEPPQANQASREELAIDYCRIFVGPRDFCPPYQSVWESGRFQSQVINSMNEFLEVVQTESDPPIKDHAGYQFEVMGVILQHEATYPDQAAGLSQAFFRDHVSWTDPMFTRAAGLAETTFYRSLLLAGARFVQIEKQQGNLNQ